MTTDESSTEGRYEIVAELGRGGLGVVMLARHVALDRLVAIKRVAGAFAIDPDARLRLQREAQTLGRLQHPNIVRLYDFVKSGDDGLIVMEYVDGASLDLLLVRDVLPPDDAATVLADLAAALTHAHAHGIVHRDVKPSNIIRAKSGRAHLSDFGLAKMRASSSMLRTRLGTVMGTPGYMAPEQILGEETNAHTDAYAFAAVAYTLLVGRPVFDVADRRSLLDAHLLAAPLPPVDAMDGFPPSASAAIVAGLAKDGAQRASVADIAQAIAAVPQGAWPAVVRTVGDESREPTPSRTEGQTGVDGGAGQNEFIVVTHDSGADSDHGSLHPPVYIPPRARSRSRWFDVAVVVAGAMLVLGIVVASRGDRASLVVHSVAVTVSPMSAACPRAVYLFSASIITNGRSGDARFRWIRPDHVSTPSQTLHVSKGTEQVHAELRFTVTGAISTDVIATLELLSPTPMSARAFPARFVCPRTS